MIEIEKSSNKIMADITTNSTQAIRATAILSVILWTKVVATNMGLGGAKMKAGGRAPEDTYQVTDTSQITEEAKTAQDRAQRMVNNDLENIPYTLVLTWGSLYCITSAAEAVDVKGYAMAHIILFSIFVVCRIMHSIVYSMGLSTARSLVWLMGLLCSFGIAINGAIAAFKIQ